MTLFAIWRELDPTLSENEREAITIRSIGALEWFPHVRWVRSFVIDEPCRLESLCTYEARSVEELRETSLRCAVPFVEIRPVEEAVTTASTSHSSGEDLCLVSGRAGAFVPPHGWQLLRSYTDRERGYRREVYLAGGGDPRPSSGVDSIERVREIHPSEWAWVYESFNIPKHWELDPATV